MVGEPKLRGLRWAMLKSFFRRSRSPEWVVREVRVTGPSSLWLRFEDGKEHEVELAQLMTGPAYKEIWEKNMFDQVRLEFDSIAWPNDADIAPETLYDGEYNGIRFVKDN